MKLLLSAILIGGSLISLNAQSFFKERTNERAGRMYIYWGWNLSNYSNSDISFSGSDYDFTLHDVVANDRQTDFEADVYFSPSTVTIPQYNFRIGYFINDHYDISFGIDHMKYVMLNNQIASISGNITNSGTPYDGTYDNDPLLLAKDFLEFEHTDGLNYANIEVRRHDNLLNLGKVTLNFTGGLGAGMLIPKTNSILLGKERYDEFNIAGFGLDAVAGLNITFYDIFFVQSELKGGYINMPNIRTTLDVSDGAKQDFWFSQLNIVFGASFNIRRNKDKN